MATPADDRYDRAECIYLIDFHTYGDDEGDVSDIFKFVQNSNIPGMYNYYCGTDRDFGAPIHFNYLSFSHWISALEFWLWMQAREEAEWRKGQEQAHG